MPTRRQILLAAPALVLGAAPLRAQPSALSAPTGPIVLTMTGRIARTNAPGAARFDRAMLAALPQGSFAGETPWTKGRVAFAGPLGAALLDHVGAEGTVLKVVALNEYASEVPVEDFRKHPVILATHRNGAEMAVRDRGPLWIIYPMDRVPALRNAEVYHRSVWQVRDIEVA
jgi:hypothetical protein